MMSPGKRPRPSRPRRGQARPAMTRITPATIKIRLMVIGLPARVGGALAILFRGQTMILGLLLDSRPEALETNLLESREKGDTRRDVRIHMLQSLQHRGEVQFFLGKDAFQREPGVFFGENGLVQAGGAESPKRHNERNIEGGKGRRATCQNAGNIRN